MLRFSLLHMRVCSTVGPRDPLWHSHGQPIADMAVADNIVCEHVVCDLSFMSPCLMAFAVGLRHGATFGVDDFGNCLYQESPVPKHLLAVPPTLPQFPSLSHPFVCSRKLLTWPWPEESSVDVYMVTASVPCRLMHQDYRCLHAYTCFVSGSQESTP